MSDLHWSSPLRRKGSQALDPLPLEVYLEILDYFCEGEDLTSEDVRKNLANLARVCRFFSSIALPRLFAKLEFSGRQNPSQIFFNPYASRFARAILKGEDPAKTLATYVKNCTFRSWQTQTSDNESVIRTRNAFFSMYCNALPKMSSIESITVNSVPIDKRLIKALKKLKKLSSLRFSRCSFEQGLDLSDLKEFASNLKLTSLVIFECGQDRVFHNAFTSIIDYGHLKSLEVDNWNTIQHIAELDGVLPLEKLTIHDVEDATLLPTLFARIPKLSQLYIYRTQVRHIDEYELTVPFQQHLLNELSIIDCPPALISLLVPSRPVKKVWGMGSLVARGDHRLVPLSLPRLDRAFLKSLQSSTESISDLTIPAHVYALDSLKSYMPNIAALRISWFHANWADDMVDPQNANAVAKILSDLFQKWPPNPSIRRLVLDFSCVAERHPPCLDLQSQNDILQSTISIAFPNIEQVNFVACINWRRSFSERTWHAYVPKAKRRYAFLIWDPIREQLVDYEGCYAQVFDVEGLD